MRVKVCGMTEIDQVKQLDAMGVDFAGFIFYPKPPRYVLRHLTGEPGRTPVRVGVSIGDTIAALHGVIGVLLALYHRKVIG